MVQNHKNQTLIRILYHKQTVNTEFIGDFLLGSKIRKFLQTLIRIFKYGQTVNTLGDFLFGLKIRKFFQTMTESFNTKRLLILNL